ncbi:MAG TPA: site-2 protease family protein [Stellaceae bacterium]|nr:site-2 protease family protein [Stellaceae bacterium]
MNATAQWADMLRDATTWVLPVIFAITFHEAAHGFVARHLGDDTAWREGRVTFNPLRHIDPFGTVVLPALLFVTSGFLFGYAKPVPVNFARLNHPRRDSVLVALAGPGTNVLLAIASALAFYALTMTPAGISEWLGRNLVNSLQINAVLCVFNMLPLPPLDGGRVAVGILPDFLARPLARVEPYGMLILLMLFVLSFAAARGGYGINLLGWLIGIPAQALIGFVLTITGHGG